MTIQNGVPRIIIESDSQLVVNFITGKIRVPKDIVNLMDNVKCLLTRSKKKYCSRVINKDVDALAKRAYL